MINGNELVKYFSELEESYEDERYFSAEEVDELMDDAYVQGYREAMFADLSPVTGDVLSSLKDEMKAIKAIQEAKKCSFAEARDIFKRSDKRGSKIIKNAASYGEDLRRRIAGQDSASYGSKYDKGILNWVKRNPKLSAGIGAGALLTAGAAGAAYIHHKKSKD